MSKNIKTTNNCLSCKREFRSNKEKQIANETNGLCLDCNATTDKKRLKLWQDRKEWRKKHKRPNPNSLIRQSDPSDFSHNSFLDSPASGRIRISKLKKKLKSVIWNE